MHVLTRLDRIELLLIAVIECLMDVPRHSKSNWQNNATETEQQLAENLITEYRQ